MAGYVDSEIGGFEPFRWLNRLGMLLAHELAPNSLKIRTAFRLTTIATIGAGLVVICHVYNELGTYIVWLLVGAGPMLSPRKAVTVLIAEALALIASVIMARALAETPWLMLPFLFAAFSYLTYVGTTRKLGSAMLLIQVVSLDTFYAVIFVPHEIGWEAAGSFGGTVIALGVIIVFDNWLWPDHGEPILMESLGASVGRSRWRLLDASNFYLGDKGATCPPLPPPTTELPAHVALLDQAVVEGISEHRRAILLAAITRVVRISLEVDRVAVTARENVPRQIRGMVQTEVREAVAAIAAVLDEMARELPTHIAVGVDLPQTASRIRVQSAIEALAARITEVRPAYVGQASSGEMENFAAFTDSLVVLADFVERLLDEPPHSLGPPAELANRRTSAAIDPATSRHSLKVGLCVVIGYVIGLITQRADLSTILTTVLITALPTYGAALRKMILRIVGAAIGGIVSLLAIIVVSPNFESLPAYLIVLIVVFYISAYSSLTSGRVSYAGKQIGTTFTLIFTGLSPSIDIYGPLWRLWGIFLGTFVVAIVAFILWPVYAGDSLLPRLRTVIRDAISLIPGGGAALTDDVIEATNSETMRILAEMLQVADDAQLEGESSAVRPAAIIQAAGTLRRISNRLASISSSRIAVSTPQLDNTTESARQAVLEDIRDQLRFWLDFFSSPENLNVDAARALIRTQLSGRIEESLALFESRLEENAYERINTWTVDHRRTILAELQSLRRIAALLPDLSAWLAQIPVAG